MYEEMTKELSYLIYNFQLRMYIRDNGHRLVLHFSGFDGKHLFMVDAFCFQQQDDIRKPWT